MSEFLTKKSTQAKPKPINVDVKTVVTTPIIQTQIPVEKPKVPRKPREPKEHVEKKDDLFEQMIKDKLDQISSSIEKKLDLKDCEIRDIKEKQNIQLQKEFDVRMESIELKIKEMMEDFKKNNEEMVKNLGNLKVNETNVLPKKEDILTSTIEELKKVNVVDVIKYLTNKYTLAQLEKAVLMTKSKQNISNIKNLHEIPTDDLELIRRCYRDGKNFNSLIRIVIEMKEEEKKKQ